jgi:pyrimidine deaminase RibD-like protein
MTRALDLAAAVSGNTGDNPAVGCVIVKHDEVIAEAATGAGGRPHAEEAALAGAGDRARGAVAYVTLEPCARRSAGGQSCAERLAAAGVTRVVVACADPHPNASGAGLALLGAAGIVVEIGLMQTEARALNAAFLAK